jgi:hypothetical protein
VPFEYSLTSLIIPNRDEATEGSVCHAARLWGLAGAG